MIYFRIGSLGVSSGLSTRVLPSACVAQVRKICQHYVRKTSGKYTDNITAARYIHQMSEEVLSQLADVAAEIKRHESNPEIFQQLLDDWNEVFPPSLAEIGTPKAVARKLKLQALEIEELKGQIAESQSNKDIDIKGILRSMDSQLQACRDSVINERRQLLFDHSHEIKCYQEKIDTLNSQHEEKIKTLAKSYTKTLDEMKSKFQQFEKLKANEMKEKEKYYTSQENNLKNEVEKLIQEKASIIETSKNKIKELKDFEEINRRRELEKRVLSQPKKVATSASNSIVSSSDMTSLHSYQFDLEDIEFEEVITDVEYEEYDDDDEEEDDDEDEEDESNDEDFTDGLQQSFSNKERTNLKTKSKKNRKSKAKKSKKKNKTKKLNKVNVKGLIAQKITNMVQEIKELKEAHESKDKNLSLMKIDIEKLITEIKYQKRSNII